MNESSRTPSSQFPIVQNIAQLLESKYIVPLIPGVSAILANIWDEENFTWFTVSVLVIFSFISLLYINIPRYSAQWAVDSDSRYATVRNVIVVARAATVGMICFGVLGTVLFDWSAKKIPGSFETGIQSFYDDLVKLSPTSIELIGNGRVEVKEDDTQVLLRIERPDDQGLAVASLRIMESPHISIPGEANYIVASAADFAKLIRDQVLKSTVRTLSIVCLILSAILLIVVFTCEFIGDLTRSGQSNKVCD